tara:strand:+ start:4920 stop:5450 length:531 start_codon:yes stop_codon:yes gene_type:complete
MKSYKLILSALALVAALSVNTFAQETANVAVGAEVVTALTVTNAGDINLGTIQAGIASTIKAGASDAVTSEANLGVTVTYGQVTIAGALSAAVDVDFTGATLDVSGGGSPVAFTTIAYSAEKNGGAGLFTTGSQIDLDGSGDATLDFGGTLAGAAAGTYSTALGAGSPITVTVTYQ